MDQLKTLGRALYVTYSAQCKDGVMVGREVISNCRAPTATKEIQQVEAFVAGSVDAKHGASNLFLTWWQELDMERA